MGEPNAADGAALVDEAAPVPRVLSVVAELADRVGPRAAPIMLSLPRVRFAADAVVFLDTAGGPALLRGWVECLGEAALYLSGPDAVLDGVVEEVRVRVLAGTDRGRDSHLRGVLPTSGSAALVGDELAAALRSVTSR